MIDKPVHGSGRPVRGRGEDRRRPRVLAEGRRVIGTDDMETPTPDDGPLYDELTADGRALLICPSAVEGLCPEHMDAIEAFCGVAAP
jgi:hypothetical protein